MAPDERAVIDELRRVYFSDGSHEQEVLHALTPLLRTMRFFVDSRASLGQFTRHASLTLPGGRVLAVEADPLRARELERDSAAWQGQSTGTPLDCSRGGH